MSLSFSIFEGPCCTSCAEHDGIALGSLDPYEIPDPLPFPEPTYPPYIPTYDAPPVIPQTTTVPVPYESPYETPPIFTAPAPVPYESPYEIPYDSPPILTAPSPSPNRLPSLLPAQLPYESPYETPYDPAPYESPPFNPLPSPIPQTTTAPDPTPTPVVSIPAWAVGTFYGQTASSGGQITLTINANGQVRADFQNAGPLTGTLNGNILSIDNALATITQSANGITAVRNDNGFRIEYSRTPANTGGSIPVQTLPPYNPGPALPVPQTTAPIPAIPQTTPPQVNNNGPANPAETTEILGFEFDQNTILIGGAVAVAAVVLLAGD